MFVLFCDQALIYDQLLDHPNETDRSDHSIEVQCNQENEDTYIICTYRIVKNFSSKIFVANLENSIQFFHQFISDDHMSTLDQLR